MRCMQRASEALRLALAAAPEAAAGHHPQNAGSAPPTVHCSGRPVRISASWLRSSSKAADASAPVGSAAAARSAPSSAASSGACIALRVLSRR